MSRKKDIKKINKIIKVLLKYPDGIWIRRISSESKISVSTIHFYLDNVLNDIVENIGVKNSKGQYFGLRIIKLKPKVKDSIEKKGLKIVLDYLRMYNKI